jgi:hypothetical protein
MWTNFVHIIICRYTDVAPTISRAINVAEEHCTDEMSLSDISFWPVEFELKAIGLGAVESWSNFIQNRIVFCQISDRDDTFVRVF